MVGLRSLTVSMAASPLPADLGRQVVGLCSEAYAEPFDQYLRDVGPGVHLLGTLDGVLVAHVMWVVRLLEPGALGPLRCAYVEAMATRPAHQRRGHASTLLRKLPALLDGFDLAALSPSDPAFYARLGWQQWRGPMFVRQEDQLTATPDEGLMVLRLPKTPPALSLDDPIVAPWRPGEVW